MRTCYVGFFVDDVVGHNFHYTREKTLKRVKGEDQCEKKHIFLLDGFESNHF